MKNILLLWFLFLTSIVCAQSSNWYKQITGTVDKYPVTIHLHKAGHNYYGYYYYESQQKPIYFSGDDSSVRNRISLIAFASNDATESFSFTINNEKATGNWKKDEKSKPVSFTGNETKPIIPLTYVHTEGEKKLRPAVAESPQATFFAGSIWPTGTSPLDAFLQKAVLQHYDEKNNGTEIGKLMLRNKMEFFRGYENDFKDVKTADFKESPSMYNVDQSEHILMVYQSPKIATIADFTYVYSGGAHGNYGTSYSSYDLVNKKQLKLADVMTAEGKKKLNALLAKAVRLQFNLKPSAPLTEVLFENKIAPNQNFYITGKGIGFSYSPYEIAAYAYGEINVFIPFKEVEASLLPSFKQLLQ